MPEYGDALTDRKAAAMRDATDWPSLERAVDLVVDVWMDHGNGRAFIYGGIAMAEAYANHPGNRGRFL